MIEIISKPWPWYVSGPMIALVMFLLLWAGGAFGVSSTLRTICSVGGAGRKVKFFDFDWRSQVWNLVFVLGAIIGGFVAKEYLAGGITSTLSPDTVRELAHLNIKFDGSLAPDQYFSWAGLTTLKGGMILVVGGFLVGFGTRWAGGCTSGHAISGLSNLQLPSLIAVIGFFIGGLVMTHLVFPLLF